MAQFIVSYDLRNSGRDYRTLYGRLAQWKPIPILESVWLVDWDTDSESLRNDLANYADPKDAIFVARLTGEAAWQGGLLSSDREVRRLIGSKTQSRNPKDPGAAKS